MCAYYINCKIDLTCLHYTVILKNLWHVANTDVCNFLKNIENKQYKNIVGKCKISQFLGLCGLMFRSATAQMAGSNPADDMDVHLLCL
jgi:K+-transporting ATPase A subunit